MHLNYNTNTMLYSNYKPANVLLLQGFLLLLFLFMGFLNNVGILLIVSQEPPG